MIEMIRLRTVWTFLLTILVGFSAAEGQDDPRGPHRLLPNGNASSIQQQMELLQKLQLLALRSKESGIDPFDGIDAEDVEKLKKWLEKTNPDVPEDLAEYLKNIDPRMLQQGLNSQNQPPLPQSEQLKKLMEQLSPQSDQQAGQPSDKLDQSPQTEKPQDDDNKSGFNFRSKRDRSRFPPSNSPTQNANPNSNTERESDANSPSESRMNDESSGSTAQDPTTDPLNDPRIPPHLRKILKQYRRDAQTNQDDPKQNGNDNNNSDANRGSRTQGGTSQFTPPDLNPDLEKLADRLRGSGSPKRGSGSSGIGGGSDFFQPGNMPNIDPQQQQEMLNQLLKLMAESDPKPKGAPDPNNTSATGQNPSTPGTDETSTTKPNDAGPLSMKNLKDSWKSILEQARTNTAKQEADAKNAAVESDSKESAPADSETTENSALSRITKAVAESMKKSAEERKQRQHERNRGTTDTQQASNLNTPTGSPNPQSQDSKKRGGMFSQLQDAAKSANKAIREFSTPPDPGDPANTTTSAAGTEDVSNSGGAAILLVAAVACTLIGLLWIFRKRIGSLLGEETANTAFEAPPAKLTTREEIVRAFHVIVSRSPGVAADWWPHSRAGQALAESSPERREAVQTLVEVYEQARYLPEDAMLSEDEYRRAKEAYERCMAS